MVNLVHSNLLFEWQQYQQLTTKNFDMEKRHQVHNLIILDESGSMECIKRTIIQGFNELVQTIKGIEKQFPEQEHFISFVSFNGLGIKQINKMFKKEQYARTKFSEKIRTNEDTTLNYFDDPEK